LFIYLVDFERKAEFDNLTETKPFFFLLLILSHIYVLFFLSFFLSCYKRNKIFNLKSLCIYTYINDVYVTREKEKKNITNDLIGRVRNRLKKYNYSTYFFFMQSNNLAGSSLYEDTLNSIHSEKIALTPLNSQLIDEKYLSKLNDETNHDDIVETNLSTINFKQFFRSKHLSIEHRFRSSLWLNLIQRDLIHKQYKFQQAIERYPEDIL